MKKKGTRPGIWVRYLIDEHKDIPQCKPEWYYEHNDKVLDPSVPEVIEYVKNVTKMIRDWGYDLIKHDYSTYDIFGAFTPWMTYGKVTKDGWHFHDRSRTSAEIVVDFYKAIQEAAGDDCIIIGCNTVSHLCAGIHQLNRTGDDTSGYDWSRTRKMGVNTLAFRLMQNGTFYMADADCVGVTGAISWSLNRLWLDVLSKSASPLFVSCKPGILNESELTELKEAWKINSVQENDCRPLDWMENKYPAYWLIDGKETYYNWYEENGIDSFKPVQK
jgi:alpha-galactosidase